MPLHQENIPFYTICKWTHTHSICQYLLQNPLQYNSEDFNVKSPFICMLKYFSDHFCTYFSNLPPIKFSPLEQQNVLLETNRKAA